MAASERIPVLVTAEEKAEIQRLAKEQNLSASEYLRRGARSFRSEEEDELLEGLSDMIAKTVARAKATADAALRGIAESNRRMEEREQERAAQQAQPASARIER